MTALLPWLGNAESVWLGMQASPFAWRAQVQRGTTPSFLDHARFQVANTRISSWFTRVKLFSHQISTLALFQRIYLLLSFNNRIQIPLPLQVLTFTSSSRSEKKICFTLYPTKPDSRQKQLRTSELCLQIPMKACKLDLSRLLTVKRSHGNIWRI